MSKDSEYKPDENVDPQLEETTTVAVKKEKPKYPCPKENCNKVYASQNALDKHTGKLNSCL